MLNIADLNDKELAIYIDNRNQSSDTIWNIIKTVYEANFRAYTNTPAWLDTLPKKKSRVRDNRIYVNMESVVNAVIANLPKPNIIPGRPTPESKKLAMAQQKFFQTKYNDRNVKETVRKGLRNLYLGRLIVLKPFWDTNLNDVNVRAIDPRMVRFAKNATKEDESDFAIEEVPELVSGIVEKFPAKKVEIMKHFGISDDKQLKLQDREASYQEAWVDDYLVCKLGLIILSRKKNPYWDWDGIQLTPEEFAVINDEKTTIETRRETLKGAKMRKISVAPAKDVDTQEVEGQEYGTPQPQAQPTSTQNLAAYYFNHFDKPRKPYIFATMFNHENTPIGSTDFITQAIPLQEDIDETKRNITENAKIVNGVVKVDSTVMDQPSATRLRFETGGVIYGKGVKDGVTRETGNPLPAFVQQSLDDSRKEIDDIMASSSAFRGVREGQETRGGRLALIDQSFLRLNELVQVVDYVNQELFNWWYQLAKVNYTEHHYAKSMGADNAVEVMDIMQDDFEDGTEVRVIPGKTLPEDRAFKYEQAQEDVKNGYISPIDYLEIAGYDNPSELGKNLVTWGANKFMAAGISEEEQAKIVPPQHPEEKPPSITIKYEDMPLDAQVQALAKAGIIVNPAIITAEKLHQVEKDRKLNQAEIEAKKKPAVVPSSKTP